MKLSNHLRATVCLLLAAAAFAACGEDQLELIPDNLEYTKWEGTMNGMEYGEKIEETKVILMFEGEDKKGNYGSISLDGKVSGFSYQTDKKMLDIHLTKPGMDFPDEWIIKSFTKDRLEMSSQEIREDNQKNLKLKRVY